MSDYVFRPELHGRMQKAFVRAAKIDGQTSRPRARMNRHITSAVEERVAKTREHLRAHIAKHRDNWTAQEAAKLLRNSPARSNLSLSNGPKPPPGAAYTADTHRAALQRRAQANVNMRCRKRIASLEKLERRMIARHTKGHERARNQTRSQTNAQSRKR